MSKNFILFKIDFSNFLVDIILTTKSYGNEISWALLDQEDCTTVCSSQPPGSYPSHSSITDKCILTTGSTYKLHCKDTFTDGWHGGYITIQGVRYCNNFCPSCYGPGQWDPLSNSGGGELYIQRDITIGAGNIY